MKDLGNCRERGGSMQHWTFPWCPEALGLLCSNLSSQRVTSHHGALPLIPNPGSAACRSKANHQLTARSWWKENTIYSRASSLRWGTIFTKTISTCQCRQRFSWAGERKAEQRTLEGVVGSRLRVLGAAWESAVCSDNSVEASGLVFSQISKSRNAWRLESASFELAPTVLKQTGCP